MNKDKIYWHGLNSISLLGPKRIAALISYFGSAKKAWEAKPALLLLVNGFQKKLVEKITVARSEMPLSLEREKLQDLGIELLTLEDKSYPFLLSSIFFPPPVLYVKGELLVEDQKAIAIVGSRRHTFYGREVAVKLAGDLAAAGITVVSGMARGIDTWAHRGVLEKGGRTIAVLGSGLDTCYPAENRNLMQEIIKKGAVLSEFPPGTKPLSQNFPRRNRVISGLSLGTVVVEAPERSGALITTEHALEQGRDVFAVPGSINSPYSRGCHRLLKEGAKLTESVEDILDELSLNFCVPPAEDIDEKSLQDLTGEEKAVFLLIPYTPVHIDMIINESSLMPAKASGILMQLELKGYIKQMPGHNYTRVSGRQDG